MAKGTVKLNGKSSAKKGAVEFFGAVIPKLRGDKSKGVHVVYGGLNEAVGRYYGWYAVEGGKETLESKAKTRAFMDGAAADGIVKVIPCRGGAMCYLAAEAPEVNDKIGKVLASL